MPTVWYAEVGSDRLIALTFDDGPSHYTPPILDLLAQHGARTTFFVQGDAVAGNEEALRRAAHDGHELGVHTWSHRRPDELTDDDLRGELHRTGDLIRDVAGAEPRLLRPPYGRAAARYERVGAELGLAPTVIWSVDGYDYQDGIAAEDIVAFVCGAIRPGAIVLLHDGRRAHRPTVEALAIVLDRVAAAGYRFLTVSQLLAHSAARSRR